MYRPHLILMDIELPGIDGFAAARRIREDLPDVTIVMVTAVGSSEQRRMAAELGAVGFVTKDRLMSDLAPLLSQVLS